MTNYRLAVFTFLFWDSVDSLRIVTSGMTGYSPATANQDQKQTRTGINNMTIHKTIAFKCQPAQLWDIVGTPDRVDWVPGVEGCEFDGEVRSLKLPGAGNIKEKILSHEPEAFSMSYSCIESPAPLQKHLASIKINPTADGCEMHWKTDVEPAAFEPFIEESMDGAIEKLHALLA